MHFAFRKTVGLLCRPAPNLPAENWEKWAYSSSEHNARKIGRREEKLLFAARADFLPQPRGVKMAADSDDLTSLSESSESLPPSGSSGPSVVSILDRLKSPRHSELARKRAVHTNPPPKGKWTCRGHGGTVSGSAGERESRRTTYRLEWTTLLQRLS